MRHACSLLGLSLLVLGLSAPASADFILSFDQPSYTINSVGGTTSVKVFVSQNGNGTQITPTNGLTSAGIALTFNNLAGVASVLSIADITPGSAFDVASSNVVGTTATLEEGTLLAPPIGTLPVLLGTFIFHGQAPGLTTISVAAITPGTSFTDVSGHTYTPTGASSTIRVNGTVPEPGSLTSVSIAALLGLGSYWRNRRRRAT